MFRDALKLSFMTLIQTELNQVKCEWNIHRVRPSPFAEAPGGKPDVLFFAPEVSGQLDVMTLLITHTL